MGERNQGLSLCRAPGVRSPQRRTGDAGIPGREDRRRRHGGHPRLGARSGREAVQIRRLAAAQPARGANDPRRLRRQRPGSVGARRGDPGGALRHRAAAPRRTDPAAALPERRHNVRAGGRDPRDSRPIRSQDAPAAGSTLPARLDRRPVAGLRRHNCEAHRHGHPHLVRASAAGGRAVPCRPPPRKRDHDGGWSATHRLDLDGPRARRPRPWVLPHHAYRGRPNCRRRSGAAARSQCGRAVRVRAACRHVPRGADGGEGVLPAYRLRLLPPREGVPCPAGAAAPARRSGPAPGGLKRSAPGALAWIRIYSVLRDGSLIRSMKDNSIWRAVREGRAALGTGLKEFASRGVPWIIEASGFGYCLIDHEHGAFDLETIADLAGWFQATNVSAIVRIHKSFTYLIPAILDQGIMGVQVSEVDNVEEARAIVGEAKYPPIGNRGISGQGMHTGYRSHGARHASEYAPWANANIIVCVSIESLEGLENVEAIAAVEGIDMIAYGHSDLSARLGVHLQLEHPTFKAAVRRIAEACNTPCKLAGGSAETEAQIEEYWRLGCKVLTLPGNDVSTYLDGLKARATRANARLKSIGVPVP